MSGSRVWLNRKVAAMGATSLLSDASHETATAVLPGFLAALGLPPAALASFLKLGAGWPGDRPAIDGFSAVTGYALTGLMPLAFVVASAWPMVFAGKLLGWTGRGIRGPLREAILAESVPSEARGRAFGFHRAGDTIGAVIGPLLAAAILAVSGATIETDAFRTVFVVALAFGLPAALTFVLVAAAMGAGAAALLTTERGGGHGSSG
jgi:hypothetical protein